MLLFNTYSWKRWHRGWCWFCCILALLASGWYATEAIKMGELPGGSTWPGLVAGIAAGVLMVYLFAFGLRKLPIFRFWFGLRPTKFWLAQHIWFGLLTLPLVCLHAGFFTRFGPLTLTLVIIYAVVMISGIWGLWQQQILPRKLLEEIPDETIRTQIPELLEQLRREAELLVLATCKAPGEEEQVSLQVLVRNRSIIQEARSGKGTGLLRILPANPVPESEPLRRYFLDVIEPYLRPEQSRRSRLWLRARLKHDFNELRGRLRPEALPVLEALEQICERRQQFDQLITLHRWLHSWITFHLSFSALLMIVLIWHVITAILYW